MLQATQRAFAHGRTKKHLLRQTLFLGSVAPTVSGLERSSTEDHLPRSADPQLPPAGPQSERSDRLGSRRIHTTQAPQARGHIRLGSQPAYTPLPWRAFGELELPIAGCGALSLRLGLQVTPAWLDNTYIRQDLEGRLHAEQTNPAPRAATKHNLFLGVLTYGHWVSPRTTTDDHRLQHGSMSTSSAVGAMSWSPSCVG